MLIETVNEKFQDDVLWEQAGKFLDLEPLVLRQLREPRLECVARVQCGSGTAALYIAAGPVVHRETIAALVVGSELTASSAAEALADFESDAALAEDRRSMAAIALRVPAGVSERALWECARDCAPVIARVIGATRLLPNDAVSAAFGRWVSGVAISFGAELSCAEETQYAPERTADALVACARLALRDSGVPAPHPSIAVMGTGPMAQTATRAFSQAGVRVIALSDESGAVAETRGLDVDDLLAHVRLGGLLAEYAGAQHVLRAQAVTSSADLVLLADNLGVFQEVATHIQAKAVLLAPGMTAHRELWAGLEASTTTVVPEGLPRSGRLLGAGQPSDIGKEVERVWAKVKVVRDQQEVSLDFALRVLVLQRLAERQRLGRP